MRLLTALLDANVLYPAPMRDLLLQVAVSDLYRAKWTADIHREWMAALLRREPHRDPKALERTWDLMDRATRDSLVSGYGPLIASLQLPDPDDRHVLAAAIAGGCDVIVTQNLQDFPDAALRPYGVEARHPDEFLGHHLRLAPAVFCAAVRKVRLRLRNPPFNIEAYLATLTGQGLVATAGELGQFVELI